MYLIITIPFPCLSGKPIGSKPPAYLICMAALPLTEQFPVATHPAPPQTSLASFTKCWGATASTTCLLQMNLLMAFVVPLPPTLPLLFLMCRQLYLHMIFVFTPHHYLCNLQVLPLLPDLRLLILLLHPPPNPAS